MRNIQQLIFLALLFVLVLPPLDKSLAVGQTSRQAKRSANEPSITDATENDVYAQVDDYQIGESEVRLLLRELRPISARQAEVIKEMLDDSSNQLTLNPDTDGEHSTAAKEDAAGSEHNALREAIVKQWIDRLVVLSYLRSIDAVIGEAEVASQLSEIDERLRAQGDDLNQFLSRSKVSKKTFATDLAWRESWRRFVEQRVTEDGLKTYYRLKHKQFDGTQLKIAHIFRSNPTVSTLEEKKSSLDLLRDVKRRIEAGDTTFEAAAAKYSEGTTANEGGIIGWIDFRGPQSAAFNSIAFQTNVGNLSDPVETSAGVHLIHVIEEKSGTIPFVETKSIVRSAMVSDLWKWVVKRHQNQITIRH